MQNTLILTLVFLAISTNIGLAQDDRTQFKSIDEVLTASKQLKPKAAVALIKSVDVVAIAKTLMDTGKAHYLGDARFAIEFPGLFEEFSDTLRRGTDYTLVGPTDAIDPDDPWLKVRYAESALAFRFNLAMFHFDNLKNDHLKFTKSLEDTRAFFEIPETSWEKLPLISRLKMLACYTDVEDPNDAG